MSVAEIQRAVIGIKLLPVEDRIRMYHWTIAEMETEALYAAFDRAFGSGYYDAVMAETDADYRAGRTLSSVY